MTTDGRSLPQLTLQSQRLRVSLLCSFVFLAPCNNIIIRQLTVLTSSRKELYSLVAQLHDSACWVEAWAILLNDTIADWVSKRQVNAMCQANQFKLAFNAVVPVVLRAPHLKPKAMTMHNVYGYSSCEDPSPVLGDTPLAKAFRAPVSCKCESCVE